MQPNQATINEVFGGPKQYLIPVFQRGYRWGEEKWEILWKDIQDVVDSKQDSFATHFIGPFIFIPNSEPAKQVPEFIVIDGQQRLITITLILCVLRDRSFELNLKGLANSIEKNTLLFSDRKDKSQQKILPRISDRETVNRIIHKANLTLDVNSNITKAYRFFYQKIKEITETVSTSEKGGELYSLTYEEILEEFYEVIANRLKMITINLDANDNPSKVFESLNFKQEKLSDADLIRNYIFMQIPVEKQEKFDLNTWQSFEIKFNEKIQDESERLETLENFYYRYLMTKKGHFQRNRLYIEFMACVDKFVKIDALDDFINELKNFSSYYLKIVNADVSDPQLRSALLRFKQLKTDTAIPLLLSLFEKFDKNEIDLSELLNILKLVESFIIRRSIMRVRTRGYSLDFSEAIQHAQNYKNLAKFLVNNKVFPKDKEIKDELLKFPIYKHEKAKASLMLKEIEASYGHKERVDTDKLTIEHIMPQTRTPEWEKMLGEKAKEVHEKYLHTIGNLTLTGYNSETGNRPFEEKRKIYSESNLVLNKNIAKQEKWDEEIMLNRHKELADIIIKIWDRPDIDATSETSVEKSGNKISQNRGLFDNEN